MWVCDGRGSAVQSHSMGRVRGRAEGHKQVHRQERTCECCTRVVWALKVAKRGLLGPWAQRVHERVENESMNHRNEHDYQIDKMFFSNDLHRRALPLLSLS